MPRKKGGPDRSSSGGSEGICQARGADYRPFLSVRDVPSRGRSSRIKSWTNGRVCHFLSRLELYCFYLYEWDLSITDIREQYPLPLSETLEIAEEFKIKHPRNPRSRDFVVMTTDFVITKKQAIGITDYACAVKPSQDLLSTRTQEKLEIEYHYWTTRGIHWSIATEREIPEAFAKNVEWLHPYFSAESLLPHTETEIRQIAPFLTQMVLQHDISLSKISAICDERLGLSLGTSLSIARYLIANREWRVDMRTRINPGEKLVFLTS